MFERRLKLFLVLLFAMTGVLALRAAHVQIVQRDHWDERARAQMTHSREIPTVRGKILDFKGHELAIDQPCIDACIDFRALTDPPDPKWVRAIAIERLGATMGDDFKKTARSKKTELIDGEVAQVNADIASMWQRLAKISDTPVEQVKEARDAIVNKVELRRRAVWYRNYDLAVKKHTQREPAPAWRRWLVDESADAPQPEQFTKHPIEEELADHPILKSVGVEEQNEIRKHIEQYPGLTLKPGIERSYPFFDAGCHLLGNLARVRREDLVSERNLAAGELWQYLPNDVIGRTGIESLAEPLLRGTRGRIELVEGRENLAARIEPVPGKDVRITIDIGLQADVTELFRAPLIANDVTKKLEAAENMYGGVVVIDVPTGEVRVLASNPTFNLNEFEARFAELNADELNFPLLNRATQVAREPGSTVKPVVGLAGIAEGVIGVYDGIECTGFMEIGGRRFQHGKCWTQGMFQIGHHQIPPSQPHVGTHGNPDGHLTFSEAVQRSCNVYFETVGDRLKMDGLADWYKRFGLGEPTGLGIAEAWGSVPDAGTVDAGERRFVTWISAIGQSTTRATPIQMANVAATIARNGVWVRPRIVREGQGLSVPPPRGVKNPRPDRVDLRLPSEALAAARQGMIDVVNTPAGSGKVVRRDDILIAGKTGTAEASSVRVLVRDEHGDLVRHADGKPKRREIKPTSPQNPNGEAPWYRGFGKDGTDIKHSWFIGFAPADDPKIAFAVMVEYGGSGGTAAGHIAKELVELCVERGYLQRNPNAKGDDAAQPASASEQPELLVPEVGD